MTPLEGMEILAAQLQRAGWTADPRNDLTRLVTTFYPPGQGLPTETSTVSHHLIILRDTVPTRAQDTNEWTAPTRWNALFFSQERVRSFGDRGKNLWNHVTFDLAELCARLAEFHAAVTADPETLAVFSALQRRT